MLAEGEEVCDRRKADVSFVLRVNRAYYQERVEFYSHRETVLKHPIFFAKYNGCWLGNTWKDSGAWRAHKRISIIVIM